MDEDNCVNNCNDKSWFNKYKPTKTSELVGNKKSINLIITWLQNFEANKEKYVINDTVKSSKKKKTVAKVENTSDEPVVNGRNKQDINCHSSILITGNHGIGKSAALEVITNELGYLIQYISNVNNINSVKKNSKDTLTSSYNSTDILGLMNGNKKDKKVLIIDKIETITSSTEKNYILMLLKENCKLWCYPIIFVSNTNHIKLLSDIKKSTFELKFYNPFPSDFMTLFAKIAKNEEMKFKDKSLVNNIIDFSQNDIRRLVFTLQDIKYTYGNQTLTSSMFDNYKNMSKQKDIDYDLFNAAEGLLYKYTDIDTCLRYYETEKVLLPLMIHQYYPQCIAWNHDNDKFKLVTDISESLSWGDIVENLIYGDQNWNMQEIHGFYTCVNTSFLLCNNRCPDSELRKCSLQFAFDLNRTSIKRINKKNINNANKCFDNMNIIDYIYINKIVRKLINSGDIKKCVELLSGYNIKLEHIESLLKIDKIKSDDSAKLNKLILTSKQKKEFMSYLE